MKKTNDRIYIAEVKDSTLENIGIRLVRAVSMPAALRHVVKSSISVRLATQDECIVHAALEIEESVKED